MPIEPSIALNDAVFHLVAGLLGLAAIGVTAWRPARNWSLVLFGLWLGIIAMAAAKLSQQDFEAVRLLAIGLFVYLPVMLLASAGLLRGWRRWFALGGALVLLLIAGDAFLVEPTWLAVERYTVVSPKIERPLKIVLLADIQTDRVGQYERSVLMQAAAERPDLLLLGGDYLQSRSDKLPALRAELQEAWRAANFHPPLGVYAVRGNVDRADWAATFEEMGIVAVDRTESFELPQLRLTCLGHPYSFQTQLQVGGGDPARFHIVLGHSPNFALGRIDGDLLLAGHTHGGQVRVPFWGPPITHTLVPRHWAAGRTELPGGGTLIVSRGIGMERGAAPRMRFFCRPELTVIELVPAPASPPAAGSRQVADRVARPSPPKLRMVPLRDVPRDTYGSSAEQLGGAAAAAGGTG
ncbi:MAG: metallophosphoesterase [Planctomycetota bacterium]